MRYTTAFARSEGTCLVGYPSARVRDSIKKTRPVTIMLVERRKYPIGRPSRPSATGHSAKDEALLALISALMARAPLPNGTVG
jgi:hypothetical protein